MKILYLTPAWHGFKEILFNGAKEITGLPSFSLPLKKLIDQGHSVDIILMHTEQEVPPLNIKVDWLNEKNIIEYIHYNLKVPQKFISIMEYKKKINKILENNQYDFVYAHGTSTAVVRKQVQKKGIPFGQRLYGTFLWDEIGKNGFIKALGKHPVEAESFLSKKDFLLVTNDGSGGDKVYNKISKFYKPNYSFKYWINGVNRISGESKPPNLKIQKPFIFYCARFDDWKRQDRIVEIMNLLMEQRVDIDCYFAGPLENNQNDYYSKIVDMVKRNGLTERVHFMGNIDKETISYMNKNSVASLSLYDVCNLTNVFHEMLSDGALIIARKDEALKDFIQDGYNGFYVNSNEEAVDYIKNIFNSPQEYSHMKKNALQTSSVKMSTWDERAEKEIQLIKNAINQKKTK
jgi:glycosyltransferase involved in cell wall biosynthesis